MFINLGIHRDSTGFYKHVNALFRRKIYDIVISQLGSNNISLDLDALILAKELTDLSIYLINSYMFLVKMY